MDRHGHGQHRSRATFEAASPSVVIDEPVAPAGTERPAGTYRAAIPRVIASKAIDSRKWDRAVALLILTAISLVVIPDLVTYLTVEHSPIVPPGEASASPEPPLAQLVSLAGSALLLALSTLLVFMRGHPNRDISGLLLLLLAVNLPYLVSPELPHAVDLPKIVLANVFILALWNFGAPVAGLKWLPVAVTVISVYSLVGGIIVPELMMYNTASEKAVVAGWELAGPFGHANVLGMYCALAFALTPLISETRWRFLVGTILFATVIAAASRTALIAAVVVVLWWLFCWLRSTISIRLAGTLLVSVSMAATFIFPFVKWAPSSFTDRAQVWAESLKVWRESPVVGMGVNWFLETAQSSAEIAKWAFVGTGHNMVVDALVKSGLVGVAVLVPLLLAAIMSTRALRVATQQIACFGFLAAFFVGATTEAIWALLPNLQLFPISGLVFAVLIVTRHDTDVCRPMEGHI